MHSLSRLCKLAFQITNFVLDGLKVNFWLWLISVHIARDVEVEVVGSDLLKGRQVGIQVRSSRVM